MRNQLNTLKLAPFIIMLAMALCACQGGGSKWSRQVKEIDALAVDYDRQADYAQSTNIFYEDWSANVYYANAIFLVVARGEIWSYRFYFKNSNLVLLETFETEINERWRFYVNNEEPFLALQTNTLANQAHEVEIDDDVHFRFTQALFAYKDYIATRLDIDFNEVYDGHLADSPWRWYANKYTQELLESTIFVDRINKLIDNEDHLKSIKQFLEMDFPIELVDDNILKVSGLGQISSPIGWYNSDIILIIDLLDDAIHVALYDEDGNATYLYTETIPSVSNAAEHLFEWTHRAEFLQAAEDLEEN